MKRIPILEMHVAHACNLGCESCSHFAGRHQTGLVSLDEARAWMEAWNGRLRPDVFGLLGGEPTLHPQLVEFLFLARRAFPDSALALTTNGFFLRRHPELPQVLESTRTLLRLTKHHALPEYESAFVEILALLRQWGAGRRFPVSLLVAQDRWTRGYRGAGSSVLPFDDGHPRQREFRATAAPG